MLYYAYKLGIAVANYCSWERTYQFAEYYSRVWYLLDNKRKKVIQKHLKFLLRSEHRFFDSEELDRLTLNTFQNFAKYLVEIFRIPLVDRKFVDKYVDRLDASDMDTALKKGKGAIIFTGHFGNWELAGVVMALLGYPTAAVAMAHKDPRINQLFLSFRDRFGITTIDMDKYAARKCLRALQDGKIIALLGDEDFSETHIEIEFLGENIQVPRGPAALSRASGAPVFPCVMIRQPGNRFIIHYEKLIYPVRTDNQEEDIKQMTMKYIWNPSHPFSSNIPISGLGLEIHK